ncbi:MAG: DUF6658 family protein [Oscillatoria sp. PMC 1051.18]|nr:DUF6658 family protein [Oscillatoria sp. PMC 1050.18]MEC5030659.1 DUF6658 family protein [Oscillatoria sp. PMC 1051.18]
MKNILKKLQLRQILTVFLAGVILFVSAACNSGDIRGARPHNPPVQAGGQNNPHKAGGDNLTQYKTSPDPKATELKNNQANGQLNLQQLIASTAVDKNLEGAQYKKDTATNERELPIISTEKKASSRVPVKSENPAVRSTVGEGRLEKAGEAFEEASEFIGGAAEQVSPKTAK